MAATKVKDPYRVLGVKRTATADEVRRAYRKRAAAAHPDRHPGVKDAAAKFHAIQAAYGLLSDPARRSAYDRTGEDPGPAPACHGAVVNTLVPFLGAVARAYVEQGGDPAKDDFLENLKRVVGEKLKEVEKERATVARCADKLRAAARRTSSEGGGECLLAAVMLQQAVQADLHASALKAECGRYEDALEFLKGFRYAKDARQAFGQLLYTFRASTSSSTNA